VPGKLLIRSVALLAGVVFGAAPDHIYCEVGDPVVTKAG